jgi:hypothetical protein
MVALVTCISMMQVAAGRVIYVDDEARGANNGSSWADAYRSLQDALDVADPCDQIWVAKGTYRPSQRTDPCDPRSATFQRINGVALYGGFPDMDSPDFKDRDPNTYETILSGDLHGNDVDVNDPCDLLHETTRAENSYHVFFHARGTNLDSTAVLDGFSITGGNANGPDYQQYGGGMHNYYSNPTIVNCNFIANSAYRGGGMYNNSSGDPTVASCTFASNTAHSGGGMYNWYSSAVITDCIFTRNSAGRSGWWVRGGGMLNFHSSPTLTNCVFSGNSAQQGGGMHNEDYSTPTVINCTFTGNSASVGGGMSNIESSATVTSCTFSHNAVSGSGGGISNYDGNQAVIGCTFSGNSARTGGGMYNSSDSSAVTVTNCIFIANDASYYGGGMHSGGGPLILTNCLFHNNSADNSGGAFSYYAGSITLANCSILMNSARFFGGAFCIGPGISHTSADLTDCIVWSNLTGSKSGSGRSYAGYGAHIYLGSDSTTSVEYNNIQGGRESIYISDDNSTLDWGEGNIDEPPLLTPDGHLQRTSPRIKAGATKAVTKQD